MTSRGGRPLDVAGRYFAVLDQLWPANVVCVAELDTVFPAGEVDAAWAQVCAASPIARCRIDASGDSTPHLLDDEVVGCDFERREGTLETVLADEQRTRFDVATGPLVRCRYVVADGSSAVLVTGHHAVLDGRGGYVLLQRLAGLLAGAAPPAPRHLPPGLQDRIRPGLRWPQDRSVVLGMLREMAERRRAAGPVDELLKPAVEPAERRLQVSLHRLDEAETAALFARTKTVGATGYGLIAASWLHAARDLFADGRPTHNLSLTTPADLRARLDPPVPGDVPGMFASLISTSHEIGAADLGAVANEVSTTVQAAVDRGEGELFFALARPGPLDGRGAAMLRSALAAAPQSLAVSNTGRLPEGADPEWVRSVWFSFAPTPNQLAFVSATTYRGRLTMAACVDRARVPIELAHRLTTGAVRRLRSG
jgi:hypothetical protein